MAFIRQARASALPSAEQPVLAPSPLRRLAVLAVERGDDTAFVVNTDAGFENRSWAEVESTVKRAAAGLMRSGMRADQVVVSFLPSAHAHPELEIALRAIGAVVIHVAPHTAPEDLVRELSGVDVRLVLTSGERDLDRLAVLQFSSAEMLDLGDDSWSRLLTLGAERLVMDPEAVARVDRIVDPDGAVARLLGPGGPITRVPAVDDGLADLISGSGTTLLVGEDSDAFVHLVRDAHLAWGGTLARVAGPADLPEAFASVHPTTLALAPRAAVALSPLMATASGPSGRRPRTARARAGIVVGLRSWFGANLTLVVTTQDLSADVRENLTGLGADVAMTSTGDALPADLPKPPLVVMGKAADLPRRSRGAPGREFKFETDRASLFEESEESGESAFVLPSLPLFSGESFLDKLLISQAREGSS